MPDGPAPEERPLPAITADEQAETAESVIAMLEERLRRMPKIRAFERAVVYYNLGLAYSEKPTGIRQLNLTRAAGHLEKSAGLFEQAQKPMERARALNALGSVLREMDRLDEALEAFRKSTELLPGEINPREHGAAMNNIGLVLGDLGRLEEAFGAFSAALQDFSGPDLVRQRTITLLNLGQASAASGDQDGLRHAIVRYLEALELADPQDDPRTWAQIHHSLGVAYTGVQDPARAAEAFQQALRVFTRNRFPFQYALSKNNLGLAYAQMGGVPALRRALASYEDALRMLDVRMHREQWEQVYRNMELAESALADLGERRTRSEHLVLLLADEEEEAMMSRMRERLTEYTLMAEPRRSNSLAELNAAVLALPDDGARKVSGGWLHVLMELPHEQFLAGLSSWMRAYQVYDEAGRERAAEIMDWTVNHELLAPQRIRVRDTLYQLGWERPLGTGASE